MRHIILTVTILSVIATPALAATQLCSGKSREYRFEIGKPGRPSLWTTPERTIKLSFTGTVGSGLNGNVYKIDGSDETIVTYWTTIVMDANEGWEDERQIMILDDRVYWPCPKE